MRKQYGTWLIILALSRISFADPTPSQKLFVFIPQTEDQAVSVLKVLDRYPKLRMVWAVSPRSFRGAKQADIKARMQALEKEGRLALALQIPNAPLLPLLLNTADAQGALPADAALLSPPYASSDDVVQHVGRAKNDFVKNWGSAPQGLILPYGAISPALAHWLQNQNFDWVIAALGLPGISMGSYQLDILLTWKKCAFWDGALPQNPASPVQVEVWDERDQKGIGGTKTLETWGKSLNQGTVAAILPEDAGLPEPQKISDTAIQKRTWTQSDWSAWIGSPEKNAEWTALAKTRQALEAYQNSGQAQMSRLDAASEEFLTAENSSFIMAAGSTTLSDIEREDRARDFEATLGSVYRLIGQTPPDDLLMSAVPSTPENGEHPLQPVFLAEGLPDNRDHARLSDAVMTLDVVASSDTLTWTVGLSSDVPTITLDVYVDINGLSNVGSTTLLPGRNLTIKPEDAWEYALSITGNQAGLYLTQAGNTFILAGNFPASGNSRAFTVTLPRSQMRGNIRHWGYRALALDKDLHVIHSLYTSHNDK